MRPLTRREIVSFIVFLPFMVLITIWLLSWGPMLDPVWVAKDGEPVPRNFTYLFFPLPGANIVDASGQQVGSFQRPILVNDERYQAGGLVDVGGAKGDRRVRIADLTTLSSWNGVEQPLEQLGAEDVSASSPVHDPMFSVSSSPEGIRRATLKFGQGVRTYKFVYESDGRSVTPLSMYRSGGKPLRCGPFTMTGLLGAFVLYSILSVVFNKLWPETQAPPQGTVAGNGAATSP
jgi:hypothetical protein